MSILENPHNLNQAITYGKSVYTSVSREYINVKKSGCCLLFIHFALNSNFSKSVCFGVVLSLCFFL